jgi:hypothetical protein
MSNQLDDQCPSAQEEQACREACLHFADQLKQFPLTSEAVARLERNLSIIALAANIAASQSTDKFIEVDDGNKWHKSVDLFENICLCHRLINGTMEYAVVEHFQIHQTYEIWNRGWNAIEVLRSFIEEQHHALRVWRGDIKVQVKEFLAEKYPGQDMSRVTDSLIH